MVTAEDPISKSHDAHPTVPAASRYSMRTTGTSGKLKSAMQVQYTIGCSITNAVTRLRGIRLVIAVSSVGMISKQYATGRSRCEVGNAYDQ